MVTMNKIFSYQCCGGPTTALSVALFLIGFLFIVLSANILGWVFMGIGLTTFGLCALIGQVRCNQK